MHPFFNSTRASMISCPTTNCRCSRGFRSSSGMVCHGTYCRLAGLAACFVTARLARECDFVFALEAGFALDFAFFFAISSKLVHPAVVQLDGCVVKIGVSQFESARLGNLAFGNHLG